MRIAVTGASGPIGSEMIAQSLQAGDEVIAVVRPGSPRTGGLPHDPDLTVVECDISDYGSISGGYGCDVFYHLAWDRTFGDGRDDVRIQTDNIRYALDQVDLAGSWHAGTFVGIGSQAEYGLADVPLNGSLPVNPSSGYGIAKFAAGRLCSIRCRQTGMRFNWARVISVFGENDADHTLIKYLLNSFSSGETPELTECGQTWDYIYVKDCARAILSIGRKGTDGRTYCIGSGQPRKLRDYVTAVRDIAAPGAEIRFGVKDYYPHQPMFLSADIRELTEDTGFIPQFSFEDGIRDIIGKTNAKRS